MSDLRWDVFRESDLARFTARGTRRRAGWEWGGAATDAWLAEFLASRRGINKVVKLRSVSRADQRHLVIVLDPRSQAGMGITLQESWTALPALEPPEPLSHLWLLPMPKDWPGLRWARRSAWSTLTASGDADATQGSSQ